MVFQSDLDPKPFMAGASSTSIMLYTLFPISEETGIQPMSCSPESTGFTSRNCAICGSDNKRVLFRQSFSGMSTGSLLRGYDVVVCEHCGFGYADHIPEQSHFDAYYRAMSKYEHQERGGQESPYDCARFGKTADAISRAVDCRDSRILDLGCANGGLLAALQNLGYKHLLGVDPSSVCAETARRMYGIDVVPGTLNDVSGLDRKFDLLVLCGVLEHIRDLRAALAVLHGLLGEGGYLFLQVPDVSHFIECRDGPFQQFSTEHINFFSDQSLANLMGQAGFVHVRCEQNRYEVEYRQFGLALDATFQKRDRANRHLVRDNRTEVELAAYIRQSRAVDDRLRRIIGGIVTTGEPILVWGVGTHTQRLLSMGGLGEATIAAFIDSNPRYQGKLLNNIPIISPGDLHGRSEPILVSSCVFQDDIQRQIREQLKLKNRLYLLYES